jgi:hypothetical protein
MWNTMIKELKIVAKDGTKFTPPMFSHVYHLTTVGEAQDNYDWFGWSIKIAGRITNPADYRYAKELSEAVEKKLVRVGPPPEEAVSSAPKDDVPF